MKELIREYKKSLKSLKKVKTDMLYLNSMISDTQWAIEYMEKGHMPGAKWSVARWSREKREIPVDPLEMSRYVKNRLPQGCAPQWMVELLESLMLSLSVREREAYELVRGQYFSFEQAGRLMGCKKGSVQNLVSRAERKIALVVRKQTISERDL
ncbi:sigma factor-like helix-turn-helix DNA-binding protein [Desulforamulus aquiferis]|uniref:Sigma factor-like helix-turn-helix DNA-binding protein n=1 Tax=Desulforamulus aquiferis TaxID=1397668 RepID=A0AAW7ZE21_9FIRM|nr:sigma factor-like helix-turn-helix DNA-binding protein [Desulforamulus aquiferis]MDO7787528.1 sigma factor-like helix-turn-helix DNA-binding protein [Desulforamulus aquiferis]RYD01631.1 hypothetical protein N752_29070 [Desulforamulus aquiferis]